jgi:hypothetical protein
MAVVERGKKLPSPAGVGELEHSVGTGGRMSLGSSGEDSAVLWRLRLAGLIASLDCSAQRGE